MTRLADPKPPYCSSCFNRPEGRVVDFEAAYDGPVIPGAVPMPVDDLMICEDCMKEAFAVLDPQNLKETIAELTLIVTDQQNEIRAKDKAIQGSKATISELVEYPVAPIPGKPKLEGVSPEVREQITKARFARRGTSPAPKVHATKKKLAVSADEPKVSA